MNCIQSVIVPKSRPGAKNDDDSLYELANGSLSVIETLECAQLQCQMSLPFSANQAEF